MKPKIIVGAGKFALAMKKPGDILVPRSSLDVTSSTDTIKRNLATVLSDEGKQFQEFGCLLNLASKINLEWCESNPEEALHVNAIGAAKMASVSAHFGMKFVHVSSGCIFDGMESNYSFKENDSPSPACVYTRSKTIAEDLIRCITPHALILRPRQVISKSINPTNMLTKFLGRPSGSKFIESPNSVTCLEDFSDMFEHLVRHDAEGTFHCANEGTMTPYEIALELTKLDERLAPLPTSYSSYLEILQVKRVNTILDIEKLKSTGYHPRSVRSALEWCIENYGR